MTSNLASFTDVLGDAEEIQNSQPLSLPSSKEIDSENHEQYSVPDSCLFRRNTVRPQKGTGQHGEFRSVEEIDPKYRDVFSYPYFNLVQSKVIEDALYSDRSMVVCAPTGSGKTVVFEMAIVQLLMEIEDKNFQDDFKIIYMAPVKALCTERLTEWYPKFTKLGLLCIEVTGDTDVDFSHLKPYKIIITTPEKWDMLTRRWRDHRSLVEIIKLFLIDEVHILNDETRGPVLEAVVSRMKTIEASSQSEFRIEQLQKQIQDDQQMSRSPPHIRFVAISATISNPEDVAAWLGSKDKPAVFYKFGDECRPVKLKRVVEGYPCPEGMSIFKFDIVLNYKLWPIIQKYHNGKPTLIFCNTRKSVQMTAETLSKELTISFTPEQKARLTALASSIKNKKLQLLLLSGVGCHHAGLLYEERLNIENAFRNRDLPILITTTTLAMGVNLPAHLVIIKNTQQYVNGAYQEYSISTVLQMVGRAGRPQFDTEATAVIMTRLVDKPRYQALVGGSEPLQSYLHKRLAENLNSEAALRTVCDVAQCVQWLRSTFLSVRAARDPRRYLAVQPDAPPHLICKKIEELCVKAMNGLASAGLITMDEACCIDSTEAGRLMSLYYLDLETMKLIMKIEGTETLEKLLNIICESHELADMHLRVDERRSLNALNRNNAAATIRFPMKGKISTRQMKLNCIIQAVLGCLPIAEPSLNQEAMKVMRIADRICKCLVAYMTRADLISQQPKYFSAVLNSLIIAKCIAAHLWENSPYVSKQLKGIGPAFSTLLAAAGKVNFMLLEESHPRDLERIMNKNAPAGNILRKQISLLPKYQLTMTPKGSDRVTVQLTLLNQAYLAENLEQLTAGDNHKCHLIVGDSENHVLLLISFKDKDLIGLYDGIISQEVTRKCNFEHKLFAHCISTTFVGIDVQTEYLFKDLEPLFSRQEITPHFNEELAPKKPTKKQTTITDTFKERKRKSNDLNISQSKEKKKRDSAVVEKFKHLKESFGITSKQLKEDLQKSEVMSKKILQDMMPNNQEVTNFHDSNDFKTSFKDTGVKTLPEDYDFGTIVKEYEYPEMITESLEDCDDSIADEHFDNILNAIETEISKGSSRTKRDVCNIDTSGSSKTRPYIPLSDRRSTVNSKRRAKSRCNYSFLELLEKNENLSDDETNVINDGRFSETIKNQVEKFLAKASNAKSAADPVIKQLMDVPSCTVPPDDVIQAKDTLSNISSEISKETDLLSTPTKKASSAKEVEDFHSEYPEVTISERERDTLDDIESHKNNIPHPDCSNILTPNNDTSRYSECDQQSTDHNILDVKFEPQYYIKEIVTGSPHNTNGALVTYDRNICKGNSVNSESDNLGANMLENRPEQNTPVVTDEKRESKNFVKETDTKSESDNKFVRDSINEIAGKDKEYDGTFNDGNSVLDKSERNTSDLASNISRDPYCHLTEEDTNICYNTNSLSHNKNAITPYSDKVVDLQLVRETVGDFRTLHKTELQSTSEYTTDNTTKYQMKEIIDKRPRDMTFMTHDQKYFSLNQLSGVDELEQSLTKNYQVDVAPSNKSYGTVGNQTLASNRADIENKCIQIVPTKTSNNSTKVVNILQGKASDIVLLGNIESRPIMYLDKSLTNTSISEIKKLNTKFTPPFKQSSQSKTLSENKYISTKLNLLPSKEDVRPNDMEMDRKQNIIKTNEPRFETSFEVLPSRSYSSNEKRVNKYSFSATKTNVCTKDQDDLRVQIIRKLRVDLDVTEILTPKNKDEVINKAKEREENNINTDPTIQAVQNPSLRKYTTVTDAEYEDLGRQGSIVINSGANVYAIQNYCLQNYETLTDATCKQFDRQESKINSNAESFANQTLTKENNKQIQEIPVCTKDESVSYDEIPVNGRINCTANNATLQRKIDCKVENNNKTALSSCGYHIGPETEQPKGKINNILQKYCKLLRKDDQMKPTLTDESKANVTPVTQISRPYKIKEISKLDVNLSKVVKNAIPETVKPCNEDIVTRIKTVKANHTRPTLKVLQTDDIKRQRNFTENSENETQQVIADDYVETAFDDDFPEASDIGIDYKSNLVEPTDLEPAMHYENIDQSMFNPKTLLQCLSEDKDENRDVLSYASKYEDEGSQFATELLNDHLDVLPPPLEFRDEDNSLHDRSPEGIYTIEKYDSESQYSEHNIHDKSIFDKDTYSVLTPSKEIETWTLAEDDSYASTESFRDSFTIMRNKSTIVPNLPYNLLQRNRKAKLGQFTYKVKSKLKL